jgi:ArsR family transcriptional regulator
MIRYIGEAPFLDASRKNGLNPTMRIHTDTPQTLVASARLIKAFADPVRLRLLNLLAVREVCVCHMHEALVLPQSTVSRHLAYLRKSGLVIGRKEGLWVHYRLAKPTTALHRTLLGCAGMSLGDAALLEADRKRLERLKSCC